jgi:hypothetical protein
LPLRAAIDVEGRAVALAAVEEEGRPMLRRQGEIGLARVREHAER